uniref:Putative EF-hand domain pair, reverse transcriptase, RNA-dependent DNA polymerase n=1 Tax=Tanacetum cinerariifolium TaxID=118510 RepID=A0A6L2JFI2_TANCI|nr:putative EF-hand domain pair, reverse transcriptase, RNA-dependent DNA polymerase [Tanacetum cinerariifolium]
MTNMIVTTPMNVIGTPVTNTVVNHAERQEKFNGLNFKRWQQKMFFYLRTLNLVRFLNETAPQVEPPREGSAPELVKRETDTRVMCTVDALKHSKTLCAITEIGKSSRIDDEVVQDQRQQDDNDLQDERQDQPNEEEVEPRRSKRARTRNRLDLILFLL